MNFLVKSFFLSTLVLLALVSNGVAARKKVVDIFETTKASILNEPKTLEELISLVENAAKKNKKISILGAGKSQGGQTVSEQDSCQISLKNINKLVSLDVANKTVTVQAGMIWRDLQKLIAPHRLAVAAMQSYNDFSIGGSLGVNVHGQDLCSNPLIKTVLSLKLLVASGDVIEVSRDKSPELFGAVIGGYGLFGIIVEVTLKLTDDILLKRVTNIIDAKDLTDYYYKNIYNKPVYFYSARFAVGPSDLMKKIIVVHYEKDNSGKESFYDFDPESLKSKSLNIFLRQVGNLLNKSDNFKDLRFGLENGYFKRSKTISRNNFMGYSIDGLPQDDNGQMFILQEYFIPYNNLNTFVKYLESVIRKYNINMLNITARHVNKDEESLLSYAKEDCCALVLYINLPKSVMNYKITKIWTSRLIDKAISLQGSYYLPYQLIGTLDQVKGSYPNFDKFMSLKKTWDPKEIFTNKFYEKYKNID